MRRFLLPALLLAAVAPQAHAAVTLLARGTLGGTTDLSPYSSTLENGLAQNVLGGLGSGLAYAGGTTFLGLPDRGPNATTWNSNVDNTVSYINRFETLNLALTPNAGGSGLAYTLTPTLTGTTLLYSPTALAYSSGVGLGVGGGNIVAGAPSQNIAATPTTPGVYYFTGRSDNYTTGSSTNPVDARFDPESIRIAPDGKSVYISDEYGPYVRQFDRATGALLRTFALPSDLAVANPQPTTTLETAAANNTVGRTANKGMEGLAITPDGKTLVGVLQAATLQDAGVKASSNLVRIVTIDVATGTTHEYGYTLSAGASGVSEIIAINDHQFLLDERDGKGLGDYNSSGVGTSAATKLITMIDTSGAADITGLAGAAANAKAQVTKRGTFLDLVAALTAAGIPANQIPSKIEGLAFGQDVLVNGTVTHTLYVANDNDFTPDLSGGNQFFVFGYTDGDIAALVPEPAGWSTMIAGFGLVGVALRRTRRAMRASISAL